MHGHRIIVISIDGLAAFYWNDPQARMPTLRRLAERGAVANHVLNRRTGAPEDLTGDPVYDAPDLLRVPTVYDRAHDAGLRTAAIDWPATRNAKTLDFNLPFFKDQRVFETQTARAVWDELRALGYPLHLQGEWAQLPKRLYKD